METMRICSKCYEDKSLDEFEYLSREGHGVVCFECRKSDKRAGRKLSVSKARNLCTNCHDFYAELPNVLCPVCRERGKAATKAGVITMEDTIRQCNQCKRLLPIEVFPVRYKRHIWYCEHCTSEHQRLRRNERQKGYDRERRQRLKSATLAKKLGR